MTLLVALRDKIDARLQEIWDKLKNYRMACAKETRVAAQRKRKIQAIQPQVNEQEEDVKHNET